ncbi:MAG: hypothetical protein AAFO87_15020 [Cyanobacteria bacterium J06607_6]
MGSLISRPARFVGGQICLWRRHVANAFAQTSASDPAVNLADGAAAQAAIALTFGQAQIS